MNFLKFLVIIAFIILTIITMKLQPSMHQPMIIENADFKLTRISDTLTSNNIPVSSSIQKPKPTEKIVQQPINLKEIQKEIEIQNQQPTSQTNHVEIQESKTVQTTIPKTQPKTERLQNTTKQIKPEIPQPEKSQIELLESIIAQAEKDDKSQQAQQEKQPTQSIKNDNFKNPYMTEQEEIIAWNKWRSNLQNQIMRDSKIDYAPLGTLFLFTFVVDKFGNISNIKVECSNPNYMDIARNNVKPAIANLQKKPILNFPRGTQRTSTVVTGLFLIGTEERYSTPNDFSDYERVTY